jgi:hypothetical protein
VTQENFDRYEDEKAKKPAADIKDVNSACQVATGSNKCPDFLTNMAVTDSTIFKVEIEGASDNLSRTLTYVFDRGIKLGAKSGTGSAGGTTGGTSGGPSGAAGPGGKSGAPSDSGSAPQFKVLFKQFR